MATITDRQIVVDGFVNAVVKFTGQLDTADISLTPAVKLTDFPGNDPRQNLVAFRIMEVDFAIGSGIEMMLAWNSIPAYFQQITPLAGRGRFKFFKTGGYVPDRTRTGFDGSISLLSTGYMVGKQNYTVTLFMKKIYVF